MNTIAGIGALGGDKAQLQLFDPAPAPVASDTLRVACPRRAHWPYFPPCGAPAGKPCVNHKGWPLEDHHIERVLLARAAGAVREPSAEQAAKTIMRDAREIPSLEES